MMKHKLLILLSFFVFSFSLYGQNQEHFFKVIPPLNDSEPQWVQLMYADNPNVNTVIQAYTSYYKTNIFEKNIHTQNYKYWLKNIQEHLTDDGYILYHNPKRLQWIDRFHENKKNISNARNHQVDIWTCIGPFETYRGSEGAMFPTSYQVNIYCLDQSVSNPNVVYAGGESSGAWKSIDKGLTWTSITKNESIKSVTDIKVAPSNENLVYLAANRSIYKSSDGGGTWSRVYNDNKRMHQIIIHPSNPDIVLAAGSDGLFRTIDGGANWTIIQDNTYLIWDIEFHPTDPSIAYLVRRNNGFTEFMKSIDTGLTWTLISTNWYDNPDPTFTDHVDWGALITVTPLKPDFVYVAMMANHYPNDDIWYGVFRSEDAGATWIAPEHIGGPYTESYQNVAKSNRISGGFSQSFYDFGFAASHTEEGKLYIGVMSLSSSTDHGNTWIRLGGYNTPSSTSIGALHPDIQDIHVLGSDIWVATDGGIDYSDDELSSFTSRKYGLAGSEFWGFDQGWNEDVFVGGRYHNGNTGYYQTYGVGNTLRLGGAESPTGYVDKINNRHTYFSDLSASRILPTTINPAANGIRYSMFPNEAYVVGRSSDVVADPRYSSHLYLGFEDAIWKSTDNGASFIQLHDFGTNLLLTDIRVSRQNPAVIYAAYNKGSQIWKSTDSGNSFSRTNDPNLGKTGFMDINPADDQEVWHFLFTNENANKVFRSLDGGATYTNMTTSTLDGHRILGGFIQGGSSNNRVYIVTEFNFFYWDNTMNEWIEYALGLPFSHNAKNVVKPFYKDGKIRLATNRGVWEALFEEPSVPLAYPMVSSDKVFCDADTLQLDCHSILNHNGATWSWSINPAPAYLSDATIRNPRVAFTTNGTYDVTLTVTDGTGATSTKTIPQMITVDNQCGQLDSLPTYALSCNGGYVALPVNSIVPTAELSVEMWAKSSSGGGCLFSIEGVCNAWTYSDGSVRSFFDGSSSGSVLYDNAITIGKWHHFVFVNNGTETSVYVDGKLLGSFNDVLGIGTINSLDRITTIAATYHGRNAFQGEIDEVIFWNKALTIDEIRDRRHLTKHNLPADTYADILAYYQFNLAGTKIYEAERRFETTSSGPAKIASTAPVGGGTSVRMTINEAGNHVFANTGLELDFAAGTLPDGEVVVTLLNHSPNEFPDVDNTMDGFYWVVNNYGTQTITPLNGLNFTPTGGVPSAIMDNPSKLYKRADNEHLDNWTEVCAVTSSTNSSIDFDNTCGLSSFSQFTVGAASPYVKVNRALSCMGTGGVVLPNNVILPTAALSIELWAKSQSGGCLFSMEGVVNAWMNTDGSIKSFFDGSSSGSVTYPTTTNDNQWHHFVFVNNGTTTSVYVDGELLGSFADILGINTLENLDRATTIGSVYNGGSPFTGEIDEFVFWNKALTLEEIRDRRHLTKNNATDYMDILAYYQFDTENAAAVEAEERYEGLLSGTGKISSTCPVGDGVSSRLTVNTAGNQVFSGTGLSINFAEGTFPNGELVVTQIQSQPDSLPATAVGVTDYWIVNNYGINTFTPLTAMSFAPSSGMVASNMISNPSFARLFKRTSNEHFNNWTELCGATTATDTNIEYDNTCSINNFSQFMIGYVESCLETAYYDNTQALPDTTRATTLIEAGNLYGNGDVIVGTGQTVVFEAESIVLKPGFQVQTGANFTARIETCNSPSDFSRIPNYEIIQKPTEVAVADLKMSVYPNPSNSQFTVTYQLNTTEKVSIQLFDIMGKKIQLLLPEQIQHKGHQQVFYSNGQLKDGTYIIRLIAGGQMAHKKIIVKN